MDAADDEDSALLKAFRAICAVQFAIDLDAGDAHLAGRDAQALRRVAHNLKSVLWTLQEPTASACAQRLEEALLLCDWPSSEAAWHILRTHLAAMTNPRVQ